MATCQCLAFLAISILTALDYCCGLQCYACYSTNLNEDVCQSYQPYEDSRLDKGDIVVQKNCTAPYDKACIIERFLGNGHALSHIRDCSDGKRFSFTNLENNGSAVKYDRLLDLKLNNETACMWNGYQHVCLSKCDTDLCNGPQINVTAINSAVTLMTSSTAFALNLFIVTMVF